MLLYMNRSGRVQYLQDASHASFRLLLIAVCGLLAFPAIGRTCLFVDGHPIDACMLISFDTGNGVPWIHSMDTDSIPQQDGFVTPGTQLGFGPPGDLRAATSVIAGKSFADEIKVVSIQGRPPLTNVSIQAFFDHIVTYDNTRGIIAVAHVVAPRPL